VWDWRGCRGTRMHQPCSHDISLPLAVIVGAQAILLGTADVSCWVVLFPGDPIASFPLPVMPGRLLLPEGWRA